MTEAKKKARSHAVVRFDARLHSLLASRQSAEGLRFRIQLIERLLLNRLENGQPPKVCRPDPRSAPVVDLWISAKVMGLLRNWVEAADVTVGDMIFTLLSEELEPKQVLELT